MAADVFERLHHRLVLEGTFVSDSSDRIANDSATQIVSHLHGSLDGINPSVQVFRHAKSATRRETDTANLQLIVIQYFSQMPQSGSRQFGRFELRARIDLHTVRAHSRRAFQGFFERKALNFPGESLFVTEARFDIPFHVARFKCYLRIGIPTRRLFRRLAEMPHSARICYFRPFAAAENLMPVSR